MGNSEDYFGELERQEEWQRNREERGTAEPYVPSGGSSQSSGCGCSGWGCLLVVTVVVLTAWLISSEFVKRDDVRVVTAVLCGKEMDGEDWLIRTSEGDFRLGDVPKRNAAQQYEALLAGGVYDITYQGMELPFLPRPVTRGVVLAPESASGRGVAPCSPER